MEPDSARQGPERGDPAPDQSNLYAMDPPDGLDARAADVTPEPGAPSDPQPAASERPWWDKGPPPAERKAATAEELAAARAALEAAEKEKKALKQHAREAKARKPAYTGLSALKATGPDSPDPYPVESPPAVTQHVEEPETSGVPEGSNRREFFKKAAAVVVGGAVVGVPVAAGVNLLLHPLSGGGAAGEAAFLPVAPLDAVPADGSPMQFPVKADRTDAWNQFRNVPVGAVFLKRVGEAVKAFNVVCPHAGCFVQTKSDGGFLCPCHNSGFNPDGSLAPKSVSPRGLDELDVKLDGPPGQQVVSVKFQNFHPATAKKQPV